jgi:hypothetical protein
MMIYFSEDNILSDMRISLGGSMFQVLNLGLMALGVGRWRVIENRKSSRVHGIAVPR